jgi:hypothetical protein
VLANTIKVKFVQQLNKGLGLIPRIPEIAAKEPKEVELHVTQQRERKTNTDTQR